MPPTSKTPTPTPWTFDPIDATATYWRIVVPGKIIVEFSWRAYPDATHFPTKEESLANAAHIVRCVNAHGALLAFAVECARADSDCGEGIRTAARAALALAAKETP